MEGDKKIIYTNQIRPRVLKLLTFEREREYAGLAVFRHEADEDTYASWVA